MRRGKTLVKQNGRKNKNPVARAIASHQSSIKRMKVKMVRIREGAEDACAGVQKEMDKKSLILKALEKGIIKP